jgi:hypothetical protein
VSILAIDIGTHLGWFLGAAVGPCEWGTEKLEDTTNLHRWLRSSDGFFQRTLPRCHHVVVEKPNTAGDSAYFAIRKNMALLGHIHYWAGFYNISIQPRDEISVMTGKLTLAGSGRAKKADMIAAAGRDGFVGMDEHAADAYGIWKVAVFGARQPITKPRTRSSKGVSLIKGAAR